MADYINPPIETDADALADDAIQYLQDNIEGWVPHDSNLEVWLAAAISRQNADSRDTASAVPMTIFRTFGSNLMGIVPVDAVAARTTTTWTAQDVKGYTIPDGTQLAFRTAGDTLIPFVTVGDVVIPPGVAATAAGAVTVQAIDAGTAANGLGPGAMELIDPLEWVTDIEATAATAGGVDAEDDATYLARLIDELRLLTPRPIFAPDFAVLARNVAGVHRAVGVDNYDPVAGTGGHERMVAVAAVDVLGANVAAPVKAAIQAYLDAMRELNFVVNVFDATHTVVGVTFQYTVNPGADPAVVGPAAEAAVSAFLAPATWGVASNDSAKVSWTNETVVRYNDVIAVLYAVDGIKSVPALTINGAAGDFALPGEVALPTVGVIDGTLA